MRDYAELVKLVKALRYCAEYDCTVDCPRSSVGAGCISGMKHDAADAIEELLKEVQSREAPEEDAE